MPHLLSSCFVLLPLVLLCLTASVEAAQHVGPVRRLLIRPLPSGAGTCKNTYQGPRLLADDQGKVCATKDLNFFTGCCKEGEGELHACSKCDTVDSCCESFEYCVSCCMSPGNKAEERRKTYPRLPNNKDAGVWDTVFDYCMAICRTHVFSTSHENAYIGARHHCFSPLGKPLLSPPLPAGTLDGVTLVLSAAGSSCAAMCEQQGLSCSPAHLHHLNSCDRLREVNNCEAGCLQEEHADYMPAAVDPEAPKASRPALCLVSNNKGTKPDSASTCEASANYMRRLCPCIKGAPSSSSKTVGSSSSSETTPPATKADNSTSTKTGNAAPAASAGSSSTTSSGPDIASGSGPAAAPGKKKEKLEGPDQLGATLFEGNGDVEAEGGAAAAAAEGREYDEDPDRERE